MQNTPVCVYISKSMHKCRPNNSESFRLDQAGYLVMLRSLLVLPNYQGRRAALILATERDVVEML